MIEKIKKWRRRNAPVYGGSELNGKHFLSVLWSFGLITFNPSNLWDASQLIRDIQMSIEPLKSFYEKHPNFSQKNLICAWYDLPDYEGEAFILYIDDCKLMSVYGSHCSCYGLENQFIPEEATIEYLKHRLDAGEWCLGDDFKLWIGNFIKEISS